MTSSSQRAWAAVLAAASLACGHAPARPARPLPQVEWPGPPSAPRVRLVGMIPSPDAPAPRRSFWERFVTALVGEDPDERARLRLVRPFGVAVASDGTVFVADPDLPGVLRADPSGALTSVTCKSREWAAPIAVALGDGGDLLVADAGAGEVVVVSPKRSCRSLGAGALERPTSVVTSGGKIVVADPPRHQIVVFSGEGSVVARWGTHGTAEDQLNYPTAVASAPDGTVLVVDALNFRIVRLDGDGRVVRVFGVPGDEGGAFARPKGVGADDAGRLYVSDAQRDLVLAFDPGGEFAYAAGASGAEPGQFQHPAGLAILRDRLYVADSQNARIQVFQILGGS